MAKGQRIVKFIRLTTALAGVFCASSLLAVAPADRTVTAKSGSRITCEVPANEVGQFTAAVEPSCDLYKTGAGTLDVMTEHAGTFVVNAGTLRAVPRAELGFSEYRIKIDGISVTATANGMQLNEQALFDGDTDVTAGYQETDFD